MIFLDLHDVVNAINTSFVVPMPSICREKILSNPKSFPIQVNRDALELNDNEGKGVLLFFNAPSFLRKNVLIEKQNLHFLL